MSSTSTTRFFRLTKIINNAEFRDYWAINRVSKNSVVSFNLTFIWGVPRLLRVNWATENLTGVSFRPVDSSKSSWVSFHELTDVIWWTTFNTDFSTFYWHLNPNHLIYQKKPKWNHFRKQCKPSHPWQVIQIKTSFFREDFFLPYCRWKWACKTLTPNFFSTTIITTNRLSYPPSFTRSAEKISLFFEEWPFFL